MTARSLLLLSLFAATVALISAAYMAIPNNAPDQAVAFERASND